ncbi:NAD-dependent epimerase/dehydratase family protein [Nitrosococcus wardiae]|uniref:NAD-dependent epimerase/dehydratase family protein n=1 Tax=Nitrosococcus wardiae TaxID=1814290 RepID=A0A4P7BYG8_9GAMM|nr:NAD-dependent epimerase/dehydratase family protein [Nitrosococcus wardiae]QBQ53512.1 NAD-dependent epimerase/dehydratase family protein [Nitrosococcus wardiae]
MRALITGATGFIGQRLVALLLPRGDSIRVLVRNVEKAKAIWPTDSLSVFRGDLTEPRMLGNLCKDVDTVFHLASGSFAEDDDSGEVEQLHRKVIVEGTRKLLELAAQTGVRRFIFISSVKAMGEGGRECLDEASPVAPQTAYGRAKLAAEQVVLEAGRIYDMQVCNLRLPMVYGGDHKGNLPRMAMAIDRGWFPPLPEVENRRSMVHVDDVVQAMLLIAENPLADHQTYIVTDGYIYSSRQIYILLCQALDRHVPWWYFPAGLLRTGAKAGDLVERVLKRRVPLNSRVLYKLIGSAWYSCAKIRKELGYRPQHSLETALPEILANLGLLRSPPKSLELPQNSTGDREQS